MARDERPYFWDEGGIPYDEYQLACVLCLEGHVVARSYRHLVQYQAYVVEINVDHQVEQYMATSARAASATLRRGGRPR